MPSAETPDQALTKPRKPTKRLTQSEIGLLLKLHQDGLTQTAIAQRLNCTQPIVGRWLEQFVDTTDHSKAYLRGSALRMAQNIVKKGRAADHVAALKGLSVLTEQSSTGVTVIVGGAGQVNIGIGLSPSQTHVQGEGEQKHLMITTGSDN